MIKMLLAELAGRAVDNEQSTAKAKVLQENVKHHVEEEETKMFKLGREVLTKEQIEDLGSRPEAEKKKVTATAATAESHRGAGEVTAFIHSGTSSNLIREPKRRRRKLTLPFS